MEEQQENLKIDQKTCICVKPAFCTKFIQNLNQNEIKQKNSSRIKTTRSPRKNSYQNKSSLDMRKKSHHRDSRRQKQVIIDGDRVIAEWQGDIIHGLATIYYKNGIIFKGIYKKGVKTSGHFIFTNGYQYIGHCEGNKFKGEGKMIFPSGATISGIWQQYNIIGIAVIDYPKGQRYIGETYNLKKHGKGELIFNDGSKFIGQFLNGSINGEGSYYKNNVLISSGMWVNSQLVANESNKKDKEINTQFILLEHLIKKLNEQSYFQAKNHNQMNKSTFLLEKKQKNQLQQSESRNIKQRNDSIRKKIKFKLA